MGKSGILKRYCSPRKSGILKLLTLANAEVWKYSVKTQSIPSGISGAADYSIRAFRSRKHTYCQQLNIRLFEHQSIPRRDPLNCSLFSVEDNEAPCA